MASSPTYPPSADPLTGKSAVLRIMRDIAADRRFTDSDDLTDYEKNPPTYSRVIAEKLPLDCAHFVCAVCAAVCGGEFLQKRVVLSKEVVWQLSPESGFGYANDLWRPYVLMPEMEKAADFFRRFTDATCQWVIGPAKFDPDAAFYGFTKEGLHSATPAKWVEKMKADATFDMTTYLEKNKIHGLGNDHLASMIHNFASILKSFKWICSNGDKVLFSTDPAAVLSPAPDHAPSSAPSHAPYHGPADVETPKERARRLRDLKKAMFS